MGEMAEEAMYNGYAEMDRDYKASKGRTICIGDPKVDKNYWRDACGKVRCVSEMDTMHIALVYKQLENKSGRFYAERRHVFLNELNHRGLTKKDWDMNILSIALGLYCFILMSQIEVLKIIMLICLDLTFTIIRFMVMNTH